MFKEFMEILLEGNPFLYKTLPQLDFSTNQVDLDILCSTMYDTMIENNGNLKKIHKSKIFQGFLLHVLCFLNFTSRTTSPQTSKNLPKTSPNLPKTTLNISPKPPKSAQNLKKNRKQK